MTIHLISFLANLGFWVVMGFYFSYFATKLNLINKNKKRVFFAKNITFSILGGMIATILYSLPEYGFALYQFFYSLLFVTSSILTSIPLKTNKLSSGKTAIRTAKGRKSALNTH